MYGGLDGGVISVAMHGRSRVPLKGGARLWMVVRHRGQDRDDDVGVDNVGVDDVIASSSTSLTPVVIVSAAVAVHL